MVGENGVWGPAKWTAQPGRAGLGCRLTSPMHALPARLRRNVMDTHVRGSIPEAWCQAPLAQTLTYL